MADILISSGVSSNKVTVVHDGVALLPLTDWKDRLDPHDAVVAAASADPLKMGELARQAVQAAGMRLIESEDLEVDLTRARQFLYLTCAEGLGSAILMAMSAGVAVVASRVGGIPEIIRDGENGLLVENHFESVAAALVRLKGDSAFACQLAANGRSTVETRFTEGQMAAATLELYKRVLRD